MIEKGKKVRFNYTLTVEGQIVDSSDASQPFEYEHGSSQIIPGLEIALEGLNIGDRKEVHIGPDDAYGPINPKAVVEIPKEQVGDGNIEIGMVLSATSTEGKTLQGVVKKIQETAVTVDFNHPLAGKELFFQVEVIEIS